MLGQEAERVVQRGSEMHCDREDYSNIVKNGHHVCILEEESVHCDGVRSQHSDKVIGQMRIGSKVHVIQVIDRLLARRFGVNQNW